MNDKKIDLLWLLALSLFTVLLRCNSIDHGLGFHPDERHIVMTLERMSWNNLNPDFFAYGSLPFYLGFFISRLIGEFLPWAKTYDGLFIIGRGISVLFGTLSVIATYILARLIFAKRSIAVVAGIFLATNVLHLQLSRFFAFDIILTAISCATLISAVSLARGRIVLGSLCGALFLGLALATKISALSLLAPIGIALLLYYPRTVRGITTACGIGALVFLGSLLVFALTEPYALIDWNKFVSQNLEQIRMTRGDWRPPYTVQYWNTTPYLYVLKQMAAWTIWWPTALLVAIGFMLMIRSDKARKNPERWILLTWIGVSFFTLAGLQVKFPRYLLPIYPALMICAAFGVDWLGGWLARLLSSRQRYLAQHGITYLCVVPAILFAYAFRGIYDRPHSYRSASTWIYEHIPNGSTIVGFHWDDKLPLSMPGHDWAAHEYSVDPFDLRIYELPDDAAKLRTLTDVLEKSDVLAWPTTRIIGSVPRVPNEYPLSTTFLKLLLSGELGFRLVHTEKVRPTLFGYEWKSDTLDESLSVYDHPKVMILKKRESLSSNQMVERVLEERGREERPVTPEELLALNLGEPAPLNSPQGTQTFEGWSILGWLCVLQILGFAVWPLLALFFPESSDRGYGMAKALGFLLFGLMCWYASLANALLLTPSGIAVACIVFSLGLASIAIFKPQLRYQLLDLYRERGITTDAFFIAGFFVLMIIRSFQPEIFWGEKPMDFGLLNYFYRLEKLPAHDPWASGYELQYYYLGIFIIAQVGKLVGLSAGVCFNVALITLTSFTLVLARSIISFFTRSTLFASCAAVIYVCAGNIEVLRLLSEGRIKSFDLFWASSRVFQSPAFAEYPIWAFLFGDLHAHVIAYPFTLLVIAYAAYLHREWFTQERGVGGGATLLFGLLVGCLFALNTWDAIAYGGFTIALFIISLCPNERRLSWLTTGERLTLTAQRAVIAAIGMALIVLPYSQEATRKVPLHWGLVYQEEFNHFRNILLFSGHWYLLALIGGAVLLVMVSLVQRRPLSPQRLLLGVLALLIPLALMAFTHFGYPLLQKGPAADGIPWPALILSLITIMLALLPGVYPLRNSSQIFLTGLGVSVGVLMILAESLFLFDRMNTIFKFYGCISALLALFALGLLAQAWEEYRAIPRFSLRAAGALTIGGALTAPIILTILAAGIIDIGIMTTFKRIEPVVRPTLDGVAYVDSYSPEEALLFRWMKQHISGTPNLLEAQGISYAEFNRVQMHTGLPVVLGWEHHVKQRGVPYEEVTKRAEAIREMYSTSQSADALSLMRAYGVDYIVVGALERKTYEPDGIRKFSENSADFAKVFAVGKTELYVPRTSPRHPEYGIGLR
jgi:YYY domain-containing protein